MAQRRSAITAGRVIGGTIAFLLLVLLLGPTLKTYVEQRREIAGLQTQVAKQRADVSAMEREKKLWADPAYVEQQARQRLKFVKVGERAYSIVDLESAAPEQTDPVLAKSSRNAWYGQLWESVKVADNPQRAAR